MTKGHLIFIGGGEDSSHIYNKIFNLAGEKKNIQPSDIKLAIIPSASSHISETVKSYKEYFSKDIGLKEENIWAVPLAVQGEGHKLSPQERLWVDNAYNQEIVEKIKLYDVVFLVGGDQRRYIEVLKKDNKISPLLKALDEFYHAGGIVVGTSAGSNVLSTNSIGGGRSEEALTNQIALSPEDDDGEKLFLFNGLGLIDDVVVDTHFAIRGRLGRLINSAALTNSRFGLGISERTAIIFHPDSTIEIIGYNSVTMIDLANAKIISKENEQLHILDVKVHLFSYGDKFNILTGKLTPYKKKENIKYIPVLGVKDYYISLNVFKENEIPNILINYMLDNEADEVIAIMDFDKYYIDGNMSSFLRFREKEDANIYYCKTSVNGKGSEQDCYCGTNIRTDIIPLRDFDTKGWSKRLNALIFGIKNAFHVVVFDNDRTYPICDAKIEIYSDNLKNKLIYKTGTNKFGKAKINNFLQPGNKYSIVIEYDKDSIIKEFAYTENMQGQYINN